LLLEISGFFPTQKQSPLPQFWHTLHWCLY